MFRMVRVLLLCHFILRTKALPRMISSVSMLSLLVSSRFIMKATSAEVLGHVEFFEFMTFSLRE